MTLQDFVSPFLLMIAITVWILVVIQIELRLYHGKRSYMGASRSYRPKRELADPKLEKLDTEYLAMANDPEIREWMDAPMGPPNEHVKGSNPLD